MTDPMAASNMMGQMGFNGGGLEASERSKEAAEKQKEQQKSAEEQKQMFLKQVLDQQAQTRLNTIKMCKPETAAMVENMIYQAVRSGAIMEKIDDAKLTSMLESLNDRRGKQTIKVNYDRRRNAMDSDDDDDDFKDLE